MKDIQMAKFTGCCQVAAVSTPDTSIVEDPMENAMKNNNNMYHIPLSNDDQLKIPLNNEFEVSELTFSKRPKVDLEFQNVKYTVNRFSFQQRKFGK